MIFCKYETFALLDEYDEVMWTDYDVVIKDSICEVWDCEKNYSTIVNHEETLGKNFIDKAVVMLFSSLLILNIFSGSYRVIMLFLLVIAASFTSFLKSR